MKETGGKDKDVRMAFDIPSNVSIFTRKFERRASND